MKPLIVANWKMNPTTLAEAKLLFDSVKKGIKGIKNVEMVICPPFLYISNLKSQSRGPSKMGGRGGRVVVSNLKLGGQDVFYEGKGTFTGEISPLMLKNLGCQYVIIGHSERRKLGETDEMINKKIKAAISAKLKPILCIGETIEERKKGKTNQVLKSQLEKGLKSILNLKSKILNLILAYEPVWAIGTGNPCQPEEARKVFLFLKKILKKTPILYGGSVNWKNATNYIKVGFNGLLVGGASLNPKEFVQLIKIVSKG